MKNFFGSVMAVTLLVAAVAKADHNQPNFGGSIFRLQSESLRLDDMVRYSDLYYQVKNAVSRFRWDVDALADCERYNNNSWGSNQACYRELNEARNAFSLVRNYLYDTYNYYPQIYQQFQRTEQALRSVQLGGGSGGPGHVIGFRCFAVDQGWEEHFQGHIGEGRTQQEARRNALMACEPMHGRCVIRSCEQVIHR